MQVSKKSFFFFEVPETNKPQHTHTHTLMDLIMFLFIYFNLFIFASTILMTQGTNTHALFLCINRFSKLFLLIFGNIKRRRGRGRPPKKKKKNKNKNQKRFFTQWSSWHISQIVGQWDPSKIKYKVFKWCFQRIFRGRAKATFGGLC